MNDTAHLAQRMIEARMIGRLYARMREVMDQEAALRIVVQTLEDAATEEGKLFATEGAPAASLQHFKTIRAFWGDALQAEVIEDDDHTFRFNVVSCRYIEAYRELGLPSELVRTLSCTRDAPFARGYSGQLRFTRTGTLADGAAGCDFCYRWVDEQ